MKVRNITEIIIHTAATPNGKPFHAPVPKPDDGKRYKWNEEIVSWIEVVKPTE